MFSTWRSIYSLGLICTINQLLHMHNFFSHIRISSVSVCEQIQCDVWQTGNGTENEGAVFLRTRYQFLRWGTSLINGFWLVDFVTHKEAVYIVCEVLWREREREKVWVGVACASETFIKYINITCYLMFLLSDRWI